MNELNMTEEPQGLQLREYLSILRLRKWWIALAIVLVVGSALAFSFRQQPVYISEAQVYVNPVPLANDQGVTEPFLNLETESRLAASPAVAQRARELLGDESLSLAELLANLTVSAEPDTEILIFEYSHRTPRTAATRAQEFARAYLDSRAQGVARNLQAQRELIDRQIEVLDDQLAATADPEQRQQIQAERFLLVQQQSTLVAPNSVAVGYVFQPAEIPNQPASPDHVKTAVLAFLAALPLGAGLALLRERFDDRLRGRADLETHAGAAVLAVVPRVAAWRDESDSPVVTLQEPKSAAAEAYKTLRTSVLFAAAQRGMETLLVTSSNAMEGKSSTTANLGVALAQSGKRVILVSADLRKPRLHRFFRAQNGMGLTNVLAGERNALEVLSWVGVENLRLLPSGPVPGNPAELLGSEAMESLLRELREASDFVLIDAAPVLPVADAMTLTPFVDAILFVADARRTTRGAIAQARQQLDQVNARVIGTVLNNFDPSRSPGSAHQHYGYNAYRVDEPIERSRARVLSWSGRRD
ncbi:MAG TPA: polysaccharide biosynthesis tyrosine autokinase [Actinomycetota bacterium]|nr:polysaccharide biosynthesis tyrosine autokinase [Actinomycetota bacterium]